MSKDFLSDDFLLDSNQAIDLYAKYASPLPILDYHNHLSPKDVAENRKFNNLTEAWLEGDHYKWRAMRINGFDEKYCTGDAPPDEKFLAWAKTVPQTLLNPLYHWTHLELKRYFGIDTLLNQHTAIEIYQQASFLLQNETFSTQALLSKMKVEVICTTDDPADDLRYHQQFAKQSVAFKMYPTFRPDKSYSTEDPIAYNSYLEKLSTTAKISIDSIEDLLQALKNRIDFFDSLGCRASDHGLQYLYFDDECLLNAPNIFKKIRNGSHLSLLERNQLQAAVLLNLCRLYHAKNWSQQFHLGASRNNNSRIFKKLGADTGHDSIGDFQQAIGLSKFLDRLDQTSQLAQTVLYNLNPADNEVFATMISNFSDGSVPGKIQWGSAWWFNDQIDGMEKQLRTLSLMGLLSRFVGMVTDSRSFLSFPRHEYFRRILCNFVGNEMDRGRIPNDISLAGELVQKVCYYNTKNYFRF
ncbi:MAG TPA: glucuronate isomerase [Cytophagales bacterium]|jgi:glucuronate isomerase|nr:glucuronate isomerase [Cytophagales bacterium]